MPILKPSSCFGCPFEKYGRFFTPDRMVKGSKVLFMAQAPGRDEEAGSRLEKRTYKTQYQYFDERTEVRPQPLIGVTGKMFEERFLPLSGLKRSEVSLANAIRCRPGLSLGLKDEDSLPGLPSTVRLEDSDAVIVKALKHCQEAHLKIPSSVKTIVTMGRYAMFALTGIQAAEREYGVRPEKVMESWRGYGVDVPSFHRFSTVDTSKYHPLTSEHRIYFTMHIAALLRDKKYFHATLEDFAKLKRLLNHEWPGKLPTWFNRPPLGWPRYSTFDTEYVPDTGELIRWSMCDHANLDHVYCVEADRTSVQQIPVAPGSIILFQNVHADLPYVRPIVNLHHVKMHDMMLAHSVLWTGEPHNLNYIQSKYGSLNKHKHLSKDHPQLYSACDSFQPALMWLSHFIPQFKQDRASWRVYNERRLELVSIIERAHDTGSRINARRLEQVGEIITERLEDYRSQARLLTDDPSFNLSGRKHMIEVLYG